MNRLSDEKRVEILECLHAGNSINGTARLLRVSHVTVLRLILAVGEQCLEREKRLRGISAPYIQCDEMWSFVHTKRKNIKQPHWSKGDKWIWVAMDEDSRFMLHWRIGARTERSGAKFLRQLNRKVAGVEVVSTDGLTAYTDPVDNGR